MSRERPPHLLDVPPDDLPREIGDRLGPPYRVRQLAEWLYLRAARSFDEMTNLPRDARATLAASYRLGDPPITTTTTPSGDGAEKALFDLDDGAKIEAVVMPAGSRRTICVSSQAGCAVGCTFCVTGFYGAGRDLTPSEIVGQVRALQLRNDIPSEQTNVVFMGMGEPLLNTDSVIIALDILYRTISPKRITISTSGITPEIERIARLDPHPNLAVSINAPDQQRRERIMPITKKYPIDSLIATLERYPTSRGRELTVEYVLLAGFNDSPDDAATLASMLRRLDVKVNAIPFNPDPNLPEWMRRPDDARIDRFASVLAARGIAVTVRRSKGLETAAACGQLRGREDRPRRV